MFFFSLLNGFLKLSLALWHHCVVSSNGRRNIYTKDERNNKIRNCMLHLRSTIAYKVYIQKSCKDTFNNGKQHCKWKMHSSLHERMTKDAAKVWNLAKNIKKKVLGPMSFFQFLLKLCVGFTNIPVKNLCTGVIYQPKQEKKEHRKDDATQFQISANL